MNIHAPRSVNVNRRQNRKIVSPRDEQILTTGNKIAGVLIPGLYSTGSATHSLYNRNVRKLYTPELWTASFSAVVIKGTGCLATGFV